MLAYTDDQWRRFWEAVGMPTLAEDPRFSSLANRNDNIEELYRLAGGCFAERSSADWLRLLAERDIPAAPITALEDLPKDPHLRAVGFFETIFTDLSFNEGHSTIEGRVVPAACTYTIIEGLLCQASMQTTGLALLEVEKKVLKPVFAGDTVNAEVEVAHIRPTSKGDRGIVTTRNDVLNQDGETVMTYRAVRMMAGRPR